MLTVFHLERGYLHSASDMNFVIIMNQSLYETLTDFKGYCVDNLWEEPMNVTLSSFEIGSWPNSELARSYCGSSHDLQYFTPILALPRDNLCQDLVDNQEIC